MTIPFLALLFRVVAGPITNVLQKKISAKGQSPLITNLVMYLLISVLILPWTFNIPWITYPASFWFAAGMVGLCGGLGNGFLVKAIRCGELSVLGPLNAYKSVIGILAGIVLLGEIPGWNGISGVLLIIIGSYFVFNTMPERFSWNTLRRKEFQYRLTAMVLTAVEAVFLKKIIQFSDPIVATAVWAWAGAGFAAILLPILAKVEWKQELSLAAAQPMAFLALGLCAAGMQGATNYVFEYVPVGYALALFQLSALVSVIFGYCFFGETSILKKTAGATVMIAGAVLIILN